VHVFLEEFILILLLNCCVVKVKSIIAKVEYGFAEYIIDLLSAVNFVDG